MQSSLPRAWHFPDRCSMHPAADKSTFLANFEEHALPPRGNYNFFLFPRQERKEYYHQSLDRAFQIAHDASYNFAITRTLLNCLCLWISCLKNNLLPSLPISRLYLMEFTRCTALLEANFIHFTSIPNNPA